MSDMPETLTIRQCSPTERAEFLVAKVPANSTFTGIVMLGYTSAPKPKPKSAEEWLNVRKAWSTKPEPEGEALVYPVEFPDMINDALGIRRSTTALRVPRKMFLIALDKVLRDHGEIE